MIKTYIQKPVAVEAIQFDGHNAEELIDALGPDAAIEDGILCWYQDGSAFPIKRGDYIVKEAAKGWRISQREVFEAEYQEDRIF